MEDREEDSGGRRVWPGCCGFGGPRKAYFSRLPAVELTQTFFSLPRAVTLRRMRDEAPPEFAFVMRAWQLITHEPGPHGYRGMHGPLEGSPRDYGLLRDTPQVRRAWEELREAAAELDARGVLFETPASFTPTAAHRQRLSAFFEGLERDGRQLIWAPSGLWSAAELLRICEDLSLVPCWDPQAEDGLPPGELAYLRLQPTGGGRPLSEHRLLELAERLQAYATAFCIFNTPASFADAARLERLLQSL